MFYEGSSPQDYIKYAINPVSKNSKDRYYVRLCKFVDETSSSINFDSTTQDTMLLVEDSGFSNCSSKTEGGSVFYGNNGRISLNRVCSDRSRTPKDGVFCSINATNEHEIKIFDSSISFSGNKSFDGKRNIKIDGNANFSSINVSFANVLNRCLFQILSITKESKIDFSIFNNNSQVKEVRLEESFINGDKNVVFKIQFCYIF